MNIKDWWATRDNKTKRLCNMAFTDQTKGLEGMRKSQIRIPYNYCRYTVGFKKIIFTLPLAGFLDLGVCAAILITIVGIVTYR